MAETNRGFVAWLQDNARILLSIALVLFLLYAVYSYSNRTERDAELNTDDEIASNFDTDDISSDLTIDEEVTDAVIADGGEIIEEGADIAEDGFTIISEGVTDAVDVVATETQEGLNDVMMQAEPEETTETPVETQEVAMDSSTESTDAEETTEDSTEMMESEDDSEDAEGETTVDTEEAYEEVALADENDTEEDKKGFFSRIFGGFGKDDTSIEDAEIVETEDIQDGVGGDAESEMQIDEEASDETGDGTDNPSETQVTQEVMKVDGVITVAAGAGDGKTHLARRATAEYLLENSATASEAQRIYIEDYLQKALPAQPVYPGTKLSFSNEMIAEAVKRSQNLSEAELANLSQYAAHVQF